MCFDPGANDAGRRYGRRDRPDAALIRLEAPVGGASICVLDQAGGVTFEGCAPTNPEAIAKLLSTRHAGNADGSFLKRARYPIGFGITQGTGFPVICLDARHANAALSMRINKSDQNDARGWLKWLAWAGAREAAVKGAVGWKNPFDAGGSKQAGGSAA